MWSKHDDPKITPNDIFSCPEVASLMHAAMNLFLPPVQEE